MRHAYPRLSRFVSTALLTVLTLLVPARASSESHLWSHGVGNSQSDQGNAIAIDANGNVVVVGISEAGIDFGGGTLPGAGNFDIVLVKYDAQGNHVWSQRFGSGSNEYGRDVAVDPTGNVFITGEIAGATDFGGGVLDPSGWGMVIAKFDPNGNHLWSYAFDDTTGSFFTHGYGVAADASGNVVLVGHFVGEMDFGGGTLTSAPSGDLVIVKFSPTGAHMWSQSFSTSNNSAPDVAVDGAGNIAFTGLLGSATVDFGGGNIVGNGDPFLVKFDANGNHLWSYGFTAGGNLLGVGGVAFDPVGNVIFDGYFNQDLNLGGATLNSTTNPSNTDVFVAKYDGAGVHQWSQNFGDGDVDRGVELSADPSGNIFLTGFFHSTTDFGGGTLTSDGSRDIFLAKLDSTGGHLWSERYGGTSVDAPTGVATDIYGGPGMSGYFRGTADFGGGPVTASGSTSSNDFFVAMYGNPSCTVDPTAIDLDTVFTDQTIDTTFTIYNDGTTELTGAVSEACDQYEILSGGGAYTIVPGDSLVVTVRYDPDSVGTHNCTIETGDSLCSDVTLNAVAFDPPICEVWPTSIADTVLTGEQEFVTVTVTNTGGFRMPIHITDDCGAVAVLNPGPHVLQPGDTVQTDLQLLEDPGVYPCSLSFNSPFCDKIPVTVTVFDYPQCEFSPTFFYDFDSTFVGDTTLTVAWVVNRNFGTAEGDVFWEAPTPDFSILTGEGAFAISDIDSHLVVFAYHPQSAGLHVNQALAGDTLEGFCLTSFDVSGYGKAPPVCTVMPDTLDFGTATHGDTVSLDFTIKNVGSENLAGTVPVACGQFVVVSGAGAFNLASGDSVIVTVEFRPVVSGMVECVLAFGNNFCSDVVLQGTGVGPPVCEISPNPLPITAIAGSSNTGDVIVKNTGEQNLTGTIAESCPEFDVTVGAGAFDIAPGESLIVTIEYSPTVEGMDTCVVSAGSVCADIDVHGTAFAPAMCEIEPDTLDFGDVLVGSATTLEFVLRSTGGIGFGGTMSEGSSHFDILSPLAYNVLPGDSMIVTIEFAPLATGVHAVSIETGNPHCVDVWATGVGVEPVCEVEPDMLSFGEVLVGDSLTKDFTIRNTGTAPLVGSVSESCDDFNLAAGSGPYNIPPNDSIIVSVTFAPETADSMTCLVFTDSLCVDVLCTGVGVDSVVTSVNPGRPLKFALEPVRPNPFNPTTTVTFTLEQTSTVDLVVYDTAGRLVRVLASGSFGPGVHTQEWDGRNDRGGQVASGVYLIRLRAEGRAVTRKAVLLK